MFDAPLTFAMPNFTLPDFNDSGTLSLPKESPLYELGFARYRNPGYVALLARSTRCNRMALLFGEMDLPGGTTAELASRNSPASGYAILQAGQSKDATWLCLKYGPHGGGHGHPDKNHFILFARGQVLAPDGGTHAYGSVLHNDWDKTTVAHNTLVVEETTQQRTQGRSIAFGTEQGVDYSITDAGPIYPDVRFIRTAALLTHELIVFVDQVQAAKPSTLDISYHQSGTWASLPPGSPWPSPSAPGYKYIQQATTRTAGEDGLVLKTSVLNDWQPAIVLAGGDPCEIITGYGILKTTEHRVPWLLQRRRAQGTAFVWALSLDGAPVKLNASEVQDAQGSPLCRADAVVVEVQDARQRWQLLVNPLKKSAVAVLPGSKAWRSNDPFAVRVVR
jgi:hypothetical protein